MVPSEALLIYPQVKNVRLPNYLEAFPPTSHANTAPRESVAESAPRPCVSFARRQKSGSCSSSYGRHSEKPANGVCGRYADIRNHCPPHHTADDGYGNQCQDELPAGQVVRLQGTLLV